MVNKRPSARYSLIYGSGAAVALLAALFSALGVTTSIGRQSGAVAYVNGAPISQSEFARAIDAMQAGLNRTLTSEDKRKALNLLIDEELIVQEALRIGLGREDRLVRKNLVQAMIRSKSLLTTDPTESELKSFFEQNRNLFASPTIVTIDAVRAETATQSMEFKNALSGNASFSEATSLAGLATIDVPSEIPMGKVADYIGGSASKITLQMSVGDIAGPIDTANGDLFIWLVSKQGGQLSLAAANDDIRIELKRRKDEKALTTYVTRLRKNARIKVMTPTH